MSGKFVSDGLIERVNLYKSHHWLFRWDVFPFAFSYSILFAAALSSNESIRLIALIAIPFVLAAHLVLFLLSQWSIKLKCKLGNKEVSDISEAEYVHVKAALNAGNDRIVKLRREAAQGEVRIAGTSHRLPREFFVFQKLTYSYDPDRNTFQRLEYPTTSSLMNILRSTGHKSQQDFVTSIRKWGLNEFDIPIPSFLDLYMVSKQSFAF
jgi:cation-transporting ATPase 13A1